MKTRGLMRAFIVMMGLLIGVAGSSAQNTYDRLSVLEEFTSATCPPCAPVGVMLKDVISPANGVVSVRFHMNWPAPNDPFNLDNPVDNEGRKNFYAVSGIPDGYLNGKKVGLSGSGGPALLSAIKADNAKKSPCKIEVTHTPTADGGAVKIKVTTNVDLKAHKLHVAVVSYHTEIPGLPSRLANSNGEEDFDDAMNKMLPNASGTSLAIDAAKDQTFDFTYTRKGQETWPSGQQYVIAYIQNNATREVMQAGTNLIVYQPVLTVDGTVWEKIGRQASKTQNLTVKNPTSVPLSVTLSVSNGEALNSAGWTVALDKDVFDIPANGSVKVKATTTGPDAASFAGIEVVAAANVSNGISKDGKGVFGYLTEGTRVAVWGGISTGGVGQYLTAAQTSFAKDVAYIPATNEALQAFPPTDFDAGVFCVGIDGRFSIPGVAQLSVLMTNQGKGVYVSAPMGMAVATYPDNQSQPGYPEANAWLTETLGLRLLATTNRYSGNTLTPFTLNGIASEQLGQNDKGTAATWNLNRPTAAWNYYCQVTDAFSVNAGAKSTGWSYSDAKTTNLVGIRNENTGKGRVVYSAWGVEHVADATARKVLMQRILDYLMPAGDRPSISLNNTSLSFGTVATGSTKDQSFTITNTGKANLEISAMTLTGTDASMFSVTAGGVDGSNVVIAPNGSRTVTVRFAPTMAKNATAALSITNNDAQAIVQLRGTASTSSVETDVVSETGAIGMTLVGANPVSSASSIRVRANGDVRMTVVNAAGQEVATLFNGMVNGTEVVNINASMLTSGAYTVVASNGSDRAVMSVVVAR
ncbi:MAG: choice-of-anchor D domain-containing protein [Candidatus Kapaibacterium sp.]